MARMTEVFGFGNKDKLVSSCQKCGQGLTADQAGPGGICPGCGLDQRRAGAQAGALGKSATGTMQQTKDAQSRWNSQDNRELASWQKRGDAAVAGARSKVASEPAPAGKNKYSRSSGRFSGGEWRED